MIIKGNLLPFLVFSTFSLSPQGKQAYLKIKNSPKVFMVVSRRLNSKKHISQMRPGITQNERTK